MFVKRPLAVLMTLLAMMGFTATAYTFNLPAQEAPVSSQKVGVTPTRPLGFLKPQGSFPRNIEQVQAPLVGNQEHIKITDTLNTAPLLDLEPIVPLTREQKGSREINLDLDYRVRQPIDLTSSWAVPALQGEYRSSREARAHPTPRGGNGEGARGRNGETTTLGFLRPFAPSPLRPFAFGRHNQRSVAITCTVTTAADSGAGTLRQCLLEAAAGDTINFDSQVFPPTAPVAIMVSTPLPSIVAHILTIDGSNAGVILDGSGLSDEGSGLLIDGADGVTIQGLQITGFPENGITLIRGASGAIIGGNSAGTGNILSGNDYAGLLLDDAGTTNNIVMGNTIGTDLTGTAPLGNAYGVVIWGGAKNNLVGGAGLARNLISGNTEVGILISGSGTSNNRVQGNYIGTDVSGTASLGNRIGILIGTGSDENTIGGTAEGARNLISGNAQAGIWLYEDGTTGNQVLGNYIGPDVTGMTALGNDGGILIGFGAQNNLIGGETEGAGNIISGNIGEGIQIQNEGTDANRVQGNYIGTDASGTASLPNRLGLTIVGGAQSNIIGGAGLARNIISGNIDVGLLLENEGTNNNQVVGNYIGPDLTGNAALGNYDGIVIGGGPQNNLIGGTGDAQNLISGNLNMGINLQGANNQVQGNYIGTNASGTASLGNVVGVLILGGDNLVGGTNEGEGNLISGNADVGIQIQTDANQVLGNYIGTDASGTLPLNNRVGVVLADDAQNNQIGGVQAGNLISGNSEVGILFQNEGTNNNQVRGNYIGTDLSGMAALGNGNGILIGFGAQDNVIGGLARNLISGNDDKGIQIESDDTSGNQVLGNYIGTNLTGMESLANNDGILIFDGAQTNIIGGVIGNLISGNTGAGIQIQNNDTNDNQVLGNYIGTDASGTLPLSNRIGVGIVDGAQKNSVGGVGVGRNIISGNGVGILLQNEDTSENKILNNYIGTDAKGMTSLGNDWGIGMTLGAENNQIGGQKEGMGNLISGNALGIVISHNQTRGNQVDGNYIGVDATGMKPLGNIFGVVLADGAGENVIGGNKGNFISGNASNGIHIQNEGTSNNQVRGNYIGTDTTGSSPLGNGLNGISLVDGATQNTIGISNTIAYNGSAGVAIEGESTLANTITRNMIYQNGGLPIDWIEMASIPAPPIFNYSPEDKLVSGSTCGQCRVEFFADTEPSSLFLAEVTADSSGKFTLTLQTAPPSPRLSATATDQDGNTSEFSFGTFTTPTLTYHLHLPVVLR